MDRQRMGRLRAEAGPIDPSPSGTVASASCGLSRLPHNALDDLRSYDALVSIELIAVECARTIAFGFVASDSIAGAADGTEARLRKSRRAAHNDACFGLSPGACCSRFPCCSASPRWSSRSFI